MQTSRPAAEERAFERRLTMVCSTPLPPGRKPKNKKGPRARAGEPEGV